MLPPYLFPDPVCHAVDSTEAQYLALWNIEDLEEFEKANKNSFRNFDSD